MGTAKQLCVSRQDSDLHAVLCFLIWHKLHSHPCLFWEVLWVPGNLSCLLLYSPLAITVLTHTFAQKYSKTFRNHQEVVIENGNVDAVLRNLLVSQIFIAKLTWGIWRGIFFFEDKLGLLLFYLALEKCLGSFIFLLLW